MTSFATIIDSAYASFHEFISGWKDKGMSIHKPILSVGVRWMVKRDMEEIHQIERSSFQFAWTEQDFKDILRQRNSVGHVAEFGDRIVGFMVYETFRTGFHLLNFAVDPDYRHQGVGSQMIHKLVNKLTVHLRTEIVLEIRETNLESQMFFKSMGFRAVGVIPEWYEDTDEDAYQFAYNLHECDTESVS